MASDTTPAPETVTAAPAAKVEAQASLPLDVAPSAKPSPSVDLSAFKESQARVAELEARLKTTDDVLGKLRDVFGGGTAAQPVDPLTEAKTLKDQAERAQQLAARAIVAAEASRFAAKEGAHDLEDVAEFVTSRKSVEIDWATGRVKDAAAVAAAVAELKTSKPHWFRAASEAAPASHPVGLTGRPVAAPTPAPVAPAPAPRVNALDLWTKPLGLVRNVVTGGGKTPM
jgi:hypothetical protein